MNEDDHGMDIGMAVSTLTTKEGGRAWELPTLQMRAKYTVCGSAETNPVPGGSALRGE